MSLDKANAAMAAARKVIAGAALDSNGLLPIRQADEFHRLLQIAQVHALIAQAEALTVIAAAVAHHWLTPSDAPDPGHPMNAGTSQTD